MTTVAPAGRVLPGIRTAKVALRRRAASAPVAARNWRGTSKETVPVPTAAVDLKASYWAALIWYCKNGGEAGLLAAYELGRQAVASRVGMLELAAWHEELATNVGERAPAESRPTVARRASEFFAECLAPFELTRSGFQQLNATLHELNGTLQDRLDAALRDFEHARGELVQQLRVADEKDEVISIVSHEVRTPLTSIHGALTLLMAGVGGELNERGQKLLDVACRNTQRLVRFVSDGLDLKRMESGTSAFDLRAVEVAPFLRQAIEASRAYALQWGVTVTLGRVPRRLHVRTDADRLMQVMTNLLSNAIKFSPPGQPVVVESSCRDRLVRISVRDHGRGVPESFRRHVFEKFAQAQPSSARGGSGLGLSISKAIVERLGGRIGFRTAAGHGTTFFFDLPEWRPARSRRK